jgi:hypothetical protein
LHGAAADPAKRGRGPQKGAVNAGRPPDAWREACRELASRDEMLDRARQILENPDHAGWLSVWKFLAEQGYGKSPQAAEVAAEAEPEVRQVIVINGQRIEI